KGRGQTQNHILAKLELFSTFQPYLYTLPSPSSLYITSPNPIIKLTNHTPNYPHYSTKMTNPSSLIFFPITLLLLFTSAAASLRSGFYKTSCPSAEAIVKRVVTRDVSRDPNLGAGIIRMHFHDCFIRGCDASVLLKSTPGGNQTERDHPANNPSLRGFEVIDSAKSELESVCPNTVSCADIIAFAARDSSFVLGRINYVVPSGRRDGRVSSFDEIVTNLPPPSFNAEQLAQNFARKGLTMEEMVVLSGAHSVGVAHCSSFVSRLYSFNDPTLDSAYVTDLKRRCPNEAGGGDATVDLDSTPNRLDNRYFADLRRRRGILSSDQTLMESALTRNIATKFASGNGGAWAGRYAKAMVKMGSIEVLTGKQGEIRKICSVVN
ncbi:Peroxidase 5, partial [Linum perenne]